MEPLDTERRAVGRIPLEALAVKGIRTMIAGIWVHGKHWLGWRRLLGSWSGASVSGPRIDGVDGRCEVGFLGLLVGCAGGSTGSWRHWVFAMAREPPGGGRRRRRERGSGAPSRRQGRGSWSGDCWQRVESLTGTRTQASPAQTQPYHGNKRQRC